MTVGGIPMVGIGYGRIDHSLIIDYVAVGLVGSISIVSADMLALLSRTSLSDLKPSVSVELDGTDISAYCGRFEIHLLGNGGHSYCEIPILSDSLSVDLHQSIISITISYTLSDGSVFSQERFRGLAHIIDPEKKIGTSKYTLTCFDLGYKLTKNTPITSGYPNGSALDIINAELAAYGFAAAYGSFVDYDVTSFNIQYYKTAADLINALANGRYPTTVFWDATGILKLTDYNDTTVSPYSFPLAAQSSQSAGEDGTDRYNQVSITGNRTITYNDTADQATKGILNVGHEAEFVTAWQQAFNIAEAICKNSQRKKYSFRSFLNPFVFPGDVVTLTLTDTTTKAVRISEVVDYCGFEPSGGGFWSDWESRATS